MHAAIVGSKLLGGLDLSPHQSRWGSTAKVLGVEVCGEFCHGILHRVFQHAFPKWARLSEDLVDDEKDDADFHKQVRSKIHRCLKFTSDVTLQRLGAAVSVIAEPLDHLFMQAQKESARGGFLFSVQRGIPTRFESPAFAYEEIVAMRGVIMFWLLASLLSPAPRSG